MIKSRNALISIEDHKFNDKSTLMEDMDEIAAGITSKMKFTNGPFRREGTSLLDFYSRGSEKLNSDYPELASDLLRR